MENGVENPVGENPKIASYLGFCVRSGKIAFGVDGAEALKKGVFLLIADGALKEHSLKTMMKLKDKFACPLVVTGENRLGELLRRPAVKAVAIKEKNLAGAILAEAKKTETQYKIYSGGTI